jgi:hypothetical protein
MRVDYGCAAARVDLGVYVLGAIEPDDRAKVDEHLQACPRCRGELASLAALPALLRRVANEQAILGESGSARQHTPSGPDGLIRKVASNRRRNRVLAAVAAVALITATAAATVSLLGRGRTQPPSPAWSATVQAASSATGVWVQVRFAPRSWGTEVEARITGLRPGTQCELWVTALGGERIAAGGWTIASSPSAFWYPASVPVPAATLRGLQISTPRGRTLVSIPVRPVPPPEASGSPHGP